MRSEWYGDNGWKKLTDTNFMVLDLNEVNTKNIKTPEEFEIQPLFEHETDAIYECYHEAFTTGDARWIYDMTEEQRRQQFDGNLNSPFPINESASFAIISGDGIAGFILVLSRSEEDAFLASIGVRPKFRRKGLSRILMNESIAVLKKQDVRNFTLGVELVNIPAVKLYEQYGFETVSRITRYSWKSEQT
jgi:ribosomal protein S18 acetylase RimI-like enzyme